MRIDWTWSHTFNAAWLQVKGLGWKIGILGYESDAPTPAPAPIISGGRQLACDVTLYIRRGTPFGVGANGVLD